MIATPLSARGSLPEPLRSVPCAAQQAVPVAASAVQVITDTTQSGTTIGPAAKSGKSVCVDTEVDGEKVGTFNESAERNRFGANWGKSAFPQRPAGR
jgi:hypothetical protein